MNIFEITSSYQEIVDTIEANGGEITPELEEALAITEDQFKQKAQSYIEVIKKTKSDLTLIKEESDRLSKLKKSKEKLIERLSTVLTDAIETFGDKSKTGTSFIDYGTGKISVRNTTVVDVNDERVKTLGDAIELDIACNKVNNQLDVIEALDLSDVNSFRMTGVDDNDQWEYTPDELNCVTATISVKMPASALINGTGYAVVKEAAKYTDDFDVTTTLNKTEVKDRLKEDGCLLPNLARLKTNKSLIIK